ncbi:MAG TPA: hypothetical protein VFM82_09165 [Flavobacteriaceae bacterium]|nr:hypothetical protein [Flavobacteriaceae bacterium]
MKNLFSRQKILFGILCMIFGFPTTFFAQSQLKNYTEQFDSVVGEENLGINNGTLNLRDYQFVIEGKTKYFQNLGYTKGTVHYDGQPYYEVKLKYDLSEEQLIFNPKNATSNIGVNLIRQKVDSFELQGLTFVNMNKLVSADKTNYKGYWHQIKIGSDFFLYIKYKKNRKDIIKNDKVFHQFDLYRTFLVDYDGNFQPISSKNDILKIFPDFSEEINRFYEANKSLENSDLPLFYTNLLNRINFLLEN